MVSYSLSFSVPGFLLHYYLQQSLKRTSELFYLSHLVSQMETQKNSSPAGANNPMITSCRKKKKDDATFLEDIKDHIDEFINASMDEHKSCFKKTVQKVLLSFRFQFYPSLHFTVFFPLISEPRLQMFGMSKVVAERNAAAQEVESSLPLRTVVSE